MLGFTYQTLKHFHSEQHTVPKDLLEFGIDKGQEIGK